MVTLKEYRDSLLQQFRESFPEGEAAALTRIVLEDVAHYTPVDVALRKDTEIPPSLVEKSIKVAQRVCSGEPIQYVLGTARFYGGSIKVTPDVLIPRPETEQLVDIIAGKWRNRTDMQVLDICTGSGCIAVALASVLPFSKVTATDISEKALNVARENARLWKVKVNFVLSDALAQTNPAKRTYNIIVSNPPYICSSEAREMDKNVLDHEPHLALFVPDNDPLKFYRPITENASRMLVPGGYLYFEINPAYSNQIAGLLNKSGFSDVNTITDIHGKKRFITALWPDE
ncbi:peptide chain release factor N(5)-glutamine methyltransferase [uncultured Muribaculum sp.]|uniref:peptide chain release factor N(5)-glutamine methyltransferase n=1 Tax=uncultured Muribaculum sp. TaxID=1918613 RepID=UPI0025B78FFB|nr:peptide chain release factor N(5)-glutamine methyltransferase [uncultured Muribaculum sp.]